MPKKITVKSKKNDKVAKASKVVKASKEKSLKIKPILKDPLKKSKVEKTIAPSPIATKPAKKAKEAKPTKSKVVKEASPKVEKPVANFLNVNPNYLTQIFPGGKNDMLKAKFDKRPIIGFDIGSKIVLIPMRTVRALDKNYKNNLCYYFEVKSKEGFIRFLDIPSLFFANESHYEIDTFYGKNPENIAQLKEINKNQKIIKTKVLSTIAKDKKDQGFRNKNIKNSISKKITKEEKKLKTIKIPK